jgi:hypothetical protein
MEAEDKLIGVILYTGTLKLKKEFTVKNLLFRAKWALMTESTQIDLNKEFVKLPKIGEFPTKYIRINKMIFRCTIGKQFQYRTYIGKDGLPIVKAVNSKHNLWQLIIDCGYYEVNNAKSN